MDDFYKRVLYDDGLAPYFRGIDLERLIGQLPAGCRSVLVLHDIEGFTHEEIAASLGIAAGTSKAHLFRARRLLRRWLSLDADLENTAS